MVAPYLATAFADADTHKAWSNEQACLRPLGQNQNCMNIGDTERQRSRCRQDGAATVFFARCPPVTTEEQVHKLFSQFGHVQEVNLYRRWQSAKTSKGCGFVRFSDPLAAAAAREALDNKYMFENSEAPMVVEWLDPTRLVNRQHTHGDRQSKSRKSHQEAAGRMSGHTLQLSRKLLATSIVSGHLSDHSSTSTQLSPFSSGGSFAGLEDAIIWSLKDQHSLSCPVHVVPVLSHGKSSQQVSTPLFGAPSLQTASSWAPTPAAGAGLISNSTTPNLLPTSNQLPSIGGVGSMNNSSTIDSACCVSAFGRAHSMRSAAPGSCGVGISLPVCSSSGAPILQQSELAQLGGGLFPADYSGQLSDMVTAELDSCASLGLSGGLASSAGMLDPTYGPPPMGPCTGEISHPLYGVAKRTGSNAAVAGALSGHQLHPGLLVPPTATGLQSGSVGAVLQPMVATGSCNTCDTSNQLIGGFSASPAAVLRAVPAGPIPAPLPAPGVSPLHALTVLKLKIAPDAASDIVASMELLSKLSGAAVKLVAMGERGLQLHLTGLLAEVDLAYQMVCLLHPQGQVTTVGWDVQA